MGRILAIDFGKKRVGIAVTDPLQMIATRLTTVPAHEIWIFLKEYFSKEFVRQWLIANGFQGHEGQVVPEMDEAFVLSVSERYIELYEKITGDQFIKSDLTNIQERIENNIQTFLNEI